MRVLYLCVLLHIWAQNHQRNVTYVTHRLKGTRSNVLLPFFFRTLWRAQNLSAARSSAESAVCTSTSSFLRANHDEKDLITHHGTLRSAGTGTTRPEVFFKSLMRNHLYCTPATPGLLSNWTRGEDTKQESFELILRSQGNPSSQKKADIKRNGAFKLIIYLFFHPACLWSFLGDLFCFKNHSNFHQFHFLFISFLLHLCFLRIVVLPWFPSVSFFVPFCFALCLIFQVRLSHYSPFIPPLLQISPSFLSTPFISVFSFPFVSASALIYKAHSFQVSASHQLSLIIQLRCQPAFRKSADKG